jgi:hypothetical protein
MSSLTFATATDDDIFSGLKPINKSEDKKADIIVVPSKPK